ncbi:hypothetical protein [Aestuariivivens sediminicola]|uniref:hypothetical protein n=1 Tax=Aestuariivivens sediminicola TaxID=2913560 RepID=UPI001F574911|nr:hypothetical protein [Aestuariivivens sediminicola]
MNLKNLPHAIAAVLFVIGALVTYIGIKIISQDIQIFENTPGDGAIPALFNIIIGGVIAFIGGLCTVALLITWAFGALIQLFVKLIELFGAKPVFITLAAVLVLLWVYFLSGFFERPIYVGTLDGSIYSEPSFTASKDTVLTAADAKLKLIHATDSTSRGYNWFLVSYGKSLKGYMWGGNLCAKGHWVNGMGGRCESDKQHVLANEFDLNELKKDQNAADVIEVLYGSLPGLWISDYTGDYEFTSQMEIANEGKVIGWWSIELEENFMGYPKFYLQLDYLPDVNKWRRRFLITRLNNTGLSLKTEGLFKKESYYKRANQIN